MTLYPRSYGLYNPEFERDACGVGLICNVKGNPERRIVEDALEVLQRLDHRGACGSERTGDGVGIMTAIPHNFFHKIAKKEFNYQLKPNRYAVGIVYLPKNTEKQKCAKGIIEELIREYNEVLVGWRHMEPGGANIGSVARDLEPDMEQLFIECKEGESIDEFERKLYLIRKRAVHQYLKQFELEVSLLYFCSLSSKTIVYKGQLTCDQLRPYFPDLVVRDVFDDFYPQDFDFQSHFAVVHSRFSTNTFPNWARSQPNRCHNGEINTLRGNKNWMKSREGQLSSEVFGDDLQHLRPIVDSDLSDSGAFDAVLELLVLSGRSLPEAVMMMIPPAWESDPQMSQELRNFYQFHSCLTEPWDGPAMFAFADGRYVGATLDRNGLRPARYWITTDGRVIFGSEVGIIDVPASQVIEKGRLEPGKLFLVDFEKQSLIKDEEFKTSVAQQFPYGEWLKSLVSLESFPKSEKETQDIHTLFENVPLTQDPLLRTFNYTMEHVHLLLKPMGFSEEGLGSMGNDEALACLSSRPRLLFEFFKQLFAQVTNPPIDPIREEIVMTLSTPIGPEGNLLDCSPNQCKRLLVKNPILTLERFAALRDSKEWKSQVIDITFPLDSSFQDTIHRICQEAEEAVKNNSSFVILSDRSVDQHRVPLPSLLACGAVHHHLVKLSIRLRVGLLLDVGDAREVHHHCLLLGFGGDAICPWMVYRTFSLMDQQGMISQKVPSTDPSHSTTDALIEGYLGACAKGLRKVMAKMGVSTLQGYKGAQVFEAVGLNSQVIEKCFVGVASRVEGLGLDALEEAAFILHSQAFPKTTSSVHQSLENPGQYHWRAGGEAHLHDPAAISTLQEATRSNSRDSFQKYCQIADQQTEACLLRGQLKLKEGRVGIPVEEVEDVKEIVKRFVTGAMSYGSISLETHQTLAVAMNRLGGKSNTGEGGEDASRFDELPNGDSQNSAIKQIASARFGVTSHYLTNAIELQIKMAQGAKPGEGGELPGYKVLGPIAKVRHSTPGVGLISPPPHHDIYSIEDLKQLIHDLKNANPSARISVKLVSEVGVGVVAAGVAKAKADHILISGYEGGTGASRWTSIKHAGLPWELGLAETHQTLVLNNLRGKVVLQADGGIRTPKDVVVAALLGAEEIGLGTIPLIALGCIMMRKCHLNTCPVGIATQDPELRKKFEGQPEHVTNFFFLLAEEVREIMATLGFRTFAEMVGHTEHLEQRKDTLPFKRGLNLTALLVGNSQRPEVSTSFHPQEAQDHELDKALDVQLIELSRAALEEKTRVEFTLPIRNVNRTVGTMLSHQISKRHGVAGLPKETIHVTFTGTAGQSFGAFLAPGVTFELIGDCNDYVGKGLSGGCVVVRPPPDAAYSQGSHTIVGNVALYGGEAFIAGMAAARFGVRNSGVIAVVEGVGAHGCEYMTGGRVVILGPVGPNFASGMSGGIAYVWDPTNALPQVCNKALVGLEVPTWDDEKFLQELVERHVYLTQSKTGKKLLSQWSEVVGQFVKVFPTDYKRVLELTGGKEVEEEVKEEPPKVSSPVVDIEEVVPKEEIVPKGPQAKFHGFKTFKRKTEPYRDVKERLLDFEEILPLSDSSKPRSPPSSPFSSTLSTDPIVLESENVSSSSTLEAERTRQAARCMDCGVPFCQSSTGCPIDNLIPEWNDLVYQNKWKEALDRLLLTNNFPEFTGSVCPAPCEGACTLGINSEAVTIKNIENAIINKAWQEGWMVPTIPTYRSGRTVAIIGSGPSGLAAADQLNRLGHFVTVYERADRVGGLLMYGIPNMKISKDKVKRRLELMKQEGVTFLPNSHVGVNVPTKDLLSYDAILLATGATRPRDLPIPGRNLKGIHFAMEFLTAATKSLLDSSLEDQQFISARGKNVIVIGGGDTGTDCIGTSLRLQCKALYNLELVDQPPEKRATDNPWPQWPRIFRVDYGHAEHQSKFGKDPREYAVLSKEFLGDEQGNVSGLKVVKVKWTRKGGKWDMQEIPNSERVIPCDLVLLAMGFLGPEEGVARELGVNLDGRSNYAASHGNFRTNVPNIFAAGDCRRGQSLVVWAINEGRGAAASIHRFLSQGPSASPLN